MLGGGKFENGAITGAFSRLFNDEAMTQRKDASTKFANNNFIDYAAAAKTLNGQVFGSAPLTPYFEMWGYAATLGVPLELPIGLMSNLAKNPVLIIKIMDAIVEVGNPTAMIFRPAPLEVKDVMQQIFHLGSRYADDAEKLILKSNGK